MNSCPLCMSWLLQHDHLIGWKKCVTCGYCCKIKGNFMITLEELNKHKYIITPEIDANLLILLDKINQVRAAWNKPMIVTSGLRSQAQQDNLIAQGKSNAPKSHHLSGKAVDIQDLDGSLYKWTQDNIQLMEQIGLWMEDGGHTIGWIHYQIVAPKSGNRFFIP